MRGEPDYDEIGPWSEVKLEIIRKYAAAYTQILSKSKLHYVYIDAFAGAGLHVSEKTGEFVPGSPLNALWVEPQFKEYHFIDMDRRKVKSLREIAAERSNVHIYEGDCNKILLREVLPNIQWSQYRRALCLLDPYGLDLKWEVIRTAGELRTIDIFLNFPTMDMNRNVLWRDPDRVTEARAARLSAFWGDDTWRDAAYTTSRNLFGYEEKLSNEEIARAFQQRLREKAGFEYVPDPMPMRNTTGALQYYLFFASQKPVARKIVEDIFAKYRDRGAR